MATVGIRFEDKSEWERRVPIIPAHVAQLRDEHGLHFQVEPSTYRTYTDERYRHVGAELTYDLSEAEVIFAVKEIPPEKLLPEKTYVFFSHVIKGQPYNMGLLRRLLDLNCTLIDYERITGDDGKRLVFFGRQAGQAGMIDSLAILGQRLRLAGQQTPFEKVRHAHYYEDVAEAKGHLEKLGQQIRTGMAIDDAPLVVGFTGYGHVSQGAQNIFDLLPHEEIAPEDLAKTVERGKEVRDRLFKVVFKKPHLAEPKDPEKSFDVDEYHARPERYRGRLIRYLPHLTVLMHCIYWEDTFPRFFTRQQAIDLWRAGERKLMVIGDVSCDIDGAIELTHKAMQPDLPGYVYDPETDTWQDGFDGPGIAVLAVDNLPCEVPRDASDRFSQALLPFVPAIARADYDRPFAELDLPPEIHRAVVTHRGELTPDHEYLEDYLAAVENASDAPT